MADPYLADESPFCLPRDMADAVPADNEQAAGSGRGTILVIDDDALIRELVGEALEEVGYRVIGVGDGGAGIALVQSGVRIDLLVTDIGLPDGLDGRQVADAARVVRPGLKVLFVTGYAGPAADDLRLEPGTELLGKPFSFDALLGTVDRMMGRA